MVFGHNASGTQVDNILRLYGSASGSALIGRDLYIAGLAGGNYGNRLVVGATDTVYTLQDSNLRPTIQATGQYPVLSLNNTVTGNPNHGPTIQFTCNGVGHQFVIGTTGNGTRLDIGFSSTSDWNPHNGITGYNGTTSMSFTTSGNVGIGSLSPQHKLVVDGYINTPNSSTGASVGLDVGYKRYVSITGTFAANTWYNTGITANSDAGIYLVSCYFDTYASGGQSYQMRYVGWLVLPAQYTNSGDASLITLHRAGHAPNAETLQLRTLLTPASIDGNIHLQWSSNFANVLDGTTGKQFYIVLHRFASHL